ncbi:unnamed protein product, partial [Rotaria sp. Silwood2]
FVIFLGIISCAAVESSINESSLSNIIRALMDYNDQQNANLGVGYNDPDNDD